MCENIGIFVRKLLSSSFDASEESKANPSKRPVGSMAFAKPYSQ